MNIEINENKSFYEAIAELCVEGEEEYINVNPLYGSGYVNRRILDVGLEFYLMEFEFKQATMALWKYREGSGATYYLFNNEIINHKFVSPDVQSNVELIEEGMMFFTESGDRRRLWMPGVRYRISGVHFSSEWLKKVHSLVSFPKHISTYLQDQYQVQMSMMYSAEIKNILQQIQAATPMLDERSQPAYLIGKCIELIIFSFDQAFRHVSLKKVKGAVHPHDMELINAYVCNFDAILADSPNLEEVASEMGMSKSKFQRVFKKVVGSSYYQFVLRSRMLRAVELLLDHRTVTEVALETGYSGTGNFTQAFKNYYHFLPSEVR